VCEIAQVQPYVLRSWEAEFPDLGVSKTKGGPRVYRRADLERVLHIKHLLFVEGLTLAGARRRLAEQAPAAAEEAESLDALLGSDARERILRVKQGLRELASMLGGRLATAARRACSSWSSRSLGDACCGNARRCRRRRPRGRKGRISCWPAFAASRAIGRAYGFSGVCGPRLRRFAASARPNSAGSRRNSGCGAAW
jgi:DNA-binding transcriptional MerR regulator